MTFLCQNIEQRFHSSTPALQWLQSNPENRRKKQRAATDERKALLVRAEDKIACLAEWT